ncbi:MAG: zinc-finger domain-containing protein [Gammaproteobacteria bacterium]|nr:zinc-finger domain-containing protein [Gammaproteobacteria bacterium]
MNDLSPSFQQHEQVESLACDQRVCCITQADLPLCCPRPNQRLWDAHPRVYLPIEALGKIACPYCDTEYVLTDRTESS